MRHENVHEKINMDKKGNTYDDLTWYLASWRLQSALTNYCDKMLSALACKILAVVIFVDL